MAAHAQGGLRDGAVYVTALGAEEKLKREVSSCGWQPPGGKDARAEPDATHSRMLCHCGHAGVQVNRTSSVQDTTTLASRTHARAAPKN